MRAVHSELESLVAERLEASALDPVTRYLRDRTETSHADRDRLQRQSEQLQQTAAHLRGSRDLALFARRGAEVALGHAEESMMPTATSSSSRLHPLSQHLPLVVPWSIEELSCLERLVALRSTLAAVASRRTVLLTRARRRAKRVLTASEAVPPIPASAAPASRLSEAVGASSNPHGAAPSPILAPTLAPVAPAGVSRASRATSGGVESVASRESVHGARSGGTTAQRHGTLASDSPSSHGTADGADGSPSLVDGVKSTRDLRSIMSRKVLESVGSWRVGGTSALASAEDGESLDDGRSSLASQQAFGKPAAAASPLLTPAPASRRDGDGDQGSAEAAAISSAERPHAGWSMAEEEQGHLDDEAGCRSVLDEAIGVGEELDDLLTSHAWMGHSCSLHPARRAAEVLLNDALTDDALEVVRLWRVAARSIDAHPPSGTNPSDAVIHARRSGMCVAWLLTAIRAVSEVRATSAAVDAICEAWVGAGGRSSAAVREALSRDTRRASTVLLARIDAL